MKISVEWLNDFIDVDIGIEELSERLTKQGLAVEGVEQIGDDYVLDLEITPNRPDLLSVFGIAREVKAMLGKNLKQNPFNLQTEHLKDNCGVYIEIENSADCPRYTGSLMENITVGYSPEWMQKRLELSGIRSLNNVVDVTNYVLLEMGHPLHAFDAEFIKGEKIVVRRARSNESIVTLDGITRKLDDSLLMIADKERPIAIAGIMGAENSEINQNTSNIFIESAYFNPALIRKGAKKLRLSTESSFRFERKADINALIPALIRANKLIEEFCNGKPKGGITDIYEGKTEKRCKVSFSIGWLNSFLGSQLKKEQIMQPLENLDLKLTGEDPIEVSAPSFRRDIEIKEDIAEEVIRMVGFDKIPGENKITFENVGTIPEKNLKFRKIRRCLISLGYSETVNISFVSLDEVNRLNLELEPLAIRNPITTNLTHLRPTLLIGLLETVKRNLNAGIRDLRLFEIGNVFTRSNSGNGIDEPPYVAGIASGKIKRSGWRGDNRPIDYYDLKGDVENLFHLLKIRELSLEQKYANLPFLDGTVLKNDNEKIGFFGSIKTTVTDYFDIAPELFAFEINLRNILKHFSFDTKFADFPKYPALLRDICLTVPNEVTHQNIVNVVKKSARGMIEKVHLFDTYNNEKLQTGTRSLTYALSFRKANRTLNDELVNQKMQEILEALRTKLGIKLRGEE